MKDFYFKMHSRLLKAAHVNNTTRTDAKLSLLDCSILSLVKSFYETSTPCYMTNEQLASTFLVTEKTIKTSLTKLYWRGFLTTQGTKHRILTYQHEKVEEFIATMLYNH